MHPTKRHLRLSYFFNTFQPFWASQTTIRPKTIACLTLTLHSETLHARNKVIKELTEQLCEIVAINCAKQFLGSYWEIQSSYRSKLEGISSFCFGPRGPYEMSKIIRTGDFSPIMFFQGSPVLVREFRFPESFSGQSHNYCSLLYCCVFVAIFQELICRMAILSLRQTTSEELSRAINTRN